MKLSALIYTTVLSIQIWSMSQFAYGLQNPNGAATRHTPDVFFDVDASFVFSDQLTKPGEKKDVQNKIPEKESTSPQSNHRTLGLGHLKNTIRWQLIDTSSLTLGLRPDALIDRGEGPSEFDSRSGAVYRQRPTPQFLNHYHLSKQMGGHLNLSVGVFDTLVPYRMSYPPSITFGLLALFPEDISAIKVQWKVLETNLSDLQLSNRSGIVFDLYGLQGRDDRTETFGAGSKHFDQAPVSRDSYIGAAVYGGWHLSANTEFGVLAGTMDGKDKGGKGNEIFAQLTAIKRLNVSSRPLVLTMDHRYVREKWEQLTERLKSLEQRSSSLSANWSLISDYSLFTGAHYGISQRHLEDLDQISRAEGYQFDFGLQSKLDGGLEYILMVSHENRTLRLPDGKIGAFVDGDHSYKELNRFALELRYYLTKGI